MIRDWGKSAEVETTDWRIADGTQASHYEGTYCLIATDNESGRPCIIAKANASRPDAAAVIRRIVHRCGVHEELVAALKESELQIRYLHEKFQPTGSGETVLSRIDAVLAKAEPKP